jgi:hypothetical protein
MIASGRDGRRTERKRLILLILRSAAWRRVSKDEEDQASATGPASFETPAPQAPRDEGVSSRSTF